MNRPKVAFLIFSPFLLEDRFDRFDIPFDSIDIAFEGRGGPPCIRSTGSRKSIIVHAKVKAQAKAKPKAKVAVAAAVAVALDLAWASTSGLALSLAQ